MNLKNKNDSYNIKNTISNVDNSDLFKENFLNVTKSNENINKKEITWKIEIPKINLLAEIAEGTDEKILNEYVGHFSETQLQDGNVGLAAHNRGYKVNYFSRVKELEIDDEIIYTYNNISKKYKVITKAIIKETDWNMLENTKDNRITLITCVENKPEYRRCIQAIEIQ